MNNSAFVTRCYGITKDPKTDDFMMVMNYVKNGSLRQHLNNSFNSIKWKVKLDILRKMAEGLKDIHNNDLIHHDFHCGNILNGGSDIYVTDLGLCQPSNVKPSQNDKKIYGVLPYVAPEVLKGKKYTQASDIYGFGIIAYEVCTGLPPYHDMAHEEFLAIRICQGLRPNAKSEYKVPQLILDIIKQCWDADSSKRPKAQELLDSYFKLHSDTNYENTVITKQIKEADEMNEKSSSSLLYTGTLSYATNPQAVYTSRLLDFKNLPEPKNAIDDNSFEYPGNFMII
jgi:serine/threonine protein kinase